MMRTVSLETLDRLGLAFLVVGNDGTVRYASDSAARRLGGGAEDVVGRPPPATGLDVAAEEPLPNDERLLLAGGEGTDLRERHRAALALVARVRHEINNPLMGALGLLELLLNRKNLDDGVRQKLETVRAETRRIRDQAALLGSLRQSDRP